MGIIYFLAAIGASVYYIQETSGFWNGVLGVLKGIIWPAMLMHKIAGMLNL